MVHAYLAVCGVVFAIAVAAAILAGAWLALGIWFGVVALVALAGRWRPRPWE